MPRGVEGFESSRIVCWCVLVSLSRDTTKGLLCLLGSYPLDEIGNEEMGGYKQVQGEAVDDIGSAVVVAAETDENSILLSLAGVCVYVADDSNTFLKLTIISRKLDTTAVVSLAHMGGGKDAY